MKKSKKNEKTIVLSKHMFQLPEVAVEKKPVPKSSYKAFMENWHMRHQQAVQMARGY